MCGEKTTKNNLSNYDINDMYVLMKHNVIFKQLIIYVPLYLPWYQLRP